MLRWLPSWRFTPAKYAITTAVCCLMLFARRPSVILRPQFFGEDGTIFFSHSYHMGSWAAISRPYNGYYHLLPRLVAEWSSVLPIRLIPLAYALSSLLFAGVAVTWFHLPHFRHIVPGDGTRLLYVLLLTVAPNQESLMKLSYVQWYLALWAVLVAIMRFPQSKIARLALALGSIVVSWTSPVVAVLLPVWLLRLRFGSRTDRNLLLGMIASTLSHAALILRLGSPISVGVLSHWPLLWRDFARAFAYRILSVGGMGLGLTSTIASASGWVGIKVAAVILLLVILSGLVGLRHRATRRLPGMLFGLYIVLSVGSFYVLRSTELLSKSGTAPFLSSQLIGPDRYFFVPMAMLYLFAFVRLETWVSAIPAVKVGLLCLLLMLHLPTFRLPAHADTDWPAYARIISARPCSGSILQVPINPGGWYMRLRIDCRKAPTP